MAFGFGLVSSVAFAFMQVLLTPLTFQWKLIGSALVAYPLIGGLGTFVVCIIYNAAASVVGGISILVGEEAVTPDKSLNFTTAAMPPPSDAAG